MNTAIATVRPSYIELRGLNLGMSFVHENGLQPGQKYPMVIEGVEEGDAEGTLDPSGYAIFGMPASAGPTSCGRPPGLPWRPIADIRSSRRPTSRTR